MFLMEQLSQYLIPATGLKRAAGLATAIAKAFSILNPGNGTET